MKQTSQPSVTFGRFIRALRETNNISLRALAETLQISAAYLSEIERGTRCAPAIATGLPKKMMEELGIKEDASDPLYHRYCDFAGESRGYSYEEINRYLATQPVLRQAIRLAELAGKDDAFWREVEGKIGSIS
jgi:transcriptional regulator with XRE-family HTH domain